VHKRIISAVKRFEFVSDRMSYIIIRCRWCHIIVLNVHVLTEDDWETIRENINISTKESLGYFELKKHKPWFDEGCSKLLDQRKEAKLQCKT
jgi:hypothetical protein